jgi:hypothetical protein
MTRRIFAPTGLLSLLLFLAAVPVLAADAVFEPAFTPGDIDWAHTRQFVDGQPAEPDAARVKKALGFAAAANWEESKWEIAAATDGKEHVHQFLIALKSPVAIGSITANAADPDEPKGSRNGGVVSYLKPGAAIPADPREAAPWIAVEFKGPQPHLRTAALPPNTKTQALLYTDIRVANAAQLIYFRVHKARLFNMTPQGSGFAEGPVDASGPTRGAGWSTRRLEKHGVTEQSPTSYILAWDGERAIDGLFLYSNAAKFKLARYDGDPAVSPALAPVAAWKPLPFTVEGDHEHGFDYWAFRYRWLGTRGLKTRGIKIDLLTVERGGTDVWIAGLAAVTDLHDAPAPTVAGADTAPPFHFDYALATAGEASLVVKNAAGQPVRRLATQALRNPGAAAEPWDLKDDRGDYVAPGKYTLTGIAGPMIELKYEMTPYPNVQQLFPDRVPWLTSHDGQNGWLADHGQNWALAARGDRVYFGATMAEAGVAFIECDNDGKKLWGKHDFGAWTGVNLMAADADAVYVECGGPVWRVDGKTREAKNIFTHGTDPKRRGWCSAMAASNGKVAFCFTGEPTLDNAVTADQIDMEHTTPKPAGNDFLRLLRLTGTPPGHDLIVVDGKPGDKDKRIVEATADELAEKRVRIVRETNGKLEFESTVGEEPTQYSVIAFKSPVPLGSVVFPGAAGGEKVEFSVLKASAPFPPRAETEADWTAFESAGKPGWNCLPAPVNTVTRALRIKFTRSGGKGPWFGHLEGLKLLNRRFENAAPSAHVRVNSGAVDAAGAWDAKRTEAIWHDKPGVYVMEWDKVEKLAGLAFKEIDGAVTEIDVWQGASTGPVPLDGPAHAQTSREPGWRNVATYKQPRRSAQYNTDNNNRLARYLDGYVDFNGEVETTAVRLRVTEQWLDNGEDGAACRKHDGRSEHGLHYTESYAAALDTRLCAIAGVAALEYIKGEPPLDPMAYERVEIYDAATGKLDKELPTHLGWHGLAFSKSGELFGIEKKHLDVVRIDPQTGAATVVVRNCFPHTMTVGPDDLIYVHTTDNKDPIRVYDMSGKLVREIGKGGGWKPGPWDPQRIGPVHRMTVDGKGSLWLLENENYPRRIVQFKTDGTFVKEILGNTFYGGGGGGTINRYDKTRAYYGRVEFELDYDKHKSRIRGLLAEGLENSDILGARLKGSPVQYLVTAPLSMDSRQGFGCVYIYEPKSGTVRLAAAVGDATAFGPLRTSAVISLLKGGAPRDFSFNWSDRNGNGVVDADEIAFEKKPPRSSGAVGRFGDDLSVTGPGVVYSVRQVLPDGTPIYERKPAPGWPNLRLNDGSYFTLAGEPAPGQPTENFAVAPDGKKVWGYPAHGGISGLNIPPWNPGQVSNEFAIIGHETAAADGLGEFMVVHANTGQWTIWTADGLLAGQVLLHKTDPRSKFLGPAVAPPGTRLDPLTASQEHFHGFFTKSETDGKYYAIFGFTTMTIAEVGGLDRFKRISAPAEVAGADIEKARAWEAGKTSRAVAGRALLAVAPFTESVITIDGKSGAKEWPGSAVNFAGDGNATFRIAYDESNLFMQWSGRGRGPIKNGGADFHRYFKTGGALDLMLSTDPKADEKRTAPSAGDLRLLITFVDEKPRAVLYQAVAGGASADEKWETATPAGGKVHFDRVALLSDVTVAMAGDTDFTVEASVPLATLGLKPKPGLILKLDWGILSTGDGNQVKQRQYWSNPATGTADEPTEARLEPHLWGHVRFE